MLRIWNASLRLTSLALVTVMGPENPGSLTIVMPVVRWKNASTMSVFAFRKSSLTLVFGFRLNSVQGVLVPVWPKPKSNWAPASGTISATMQIISSLVFIRGLRGRSVAS